MRSLTVRNVSGSGKSTGRGNESSLISCGLTTDPQLPRGTPIFGSARLVQRPSPSLAQYTSARTVPSALKNRLARRRPSNGTESSLPWAACRDGRIITDQIREVEAIEGPVRVRIGLHGPDVRATPAAIRRNQPRCIASSPFNPVRLSASRPSTSSSAPTPPSSPPQTWAFEFASSVRRTLWP